LKIDIKKLNEIDSPYIVKTKVITPEYTEAVIICETSDKELFTISGSEGSITLEEHWDYRVMVRVNGSLKIRIKINRAYVALYDDCVAVIESEYCRIVCHDNSSVEILGKNNVVNAFDNSLVEIKEEAEIYASGTVEMFIKSYCNIVAKNSCKIKCYHLCNVDLKDNSILTLIPHRIIKNQPVNIQASNLSVVIIDAQNTYNLSAVTINLTDFATLDTYQIGFHLIANKFSRLVLHKSKNSFAKWIKKSIGEFVQIILSEFNAPEDMIVYKKVKSITNGDCIIAKLLIKKGQIIQALNFGKMRTSEAKVLEIFDRFDQQYTFAVSLYDISFQYIVGKKVKAKYTKKLTECESGIHFFLTQKEAEDY
jgi:hypothetical protein